MSLNHNLFREMAGQEMSNFFGGGAGAKGAQGAFSSLVGSLSKLGTNDSDGAQASGASPGEKEASATSSPSQGVKVVPFPEESRPVPGATVPRASLETPVEELTNCWGSSPGCEFNVRVGPNYKKFGKKEPSLSSFYEIAAFDFIKTQNVVEHIALFMAMNKVESEVESFDHPDVPRIFVVNCQLPDGEPQMFNAPEDGPGKSAVFFFSLKPEIAAALSDVDAAAPALKLLVEYFRRASSEPEFRGRFKVIATVKNMEQLDLPGFISNYNGKPVLITKSGTFFKGDGYCEMDIRVHRFSYLAKKGLNFLQSKFAQMVFDVGFVVEARSDEEMPEQMLGTARLFRLDYGKASEVFQFA